MPQILLDSLKRQYPDREIIRARVNEMLTEGKLTQSEYDYITGGETWENA